MCIGIFFCKNIENIFEKMFSSDLLKKVLHTFQTKKNVDRNFRQKLTFFQFFFYEIYFFFLKLSGVFPH